MKLRARFSKTGKVRFVSHRDVARIWERSLRRAGLPVAYTEGFSPRPKLSFGLALSTGYESLGEYVDINLRDEVVDEDIKEQFPTLLDPTLPVGLEVQAVESLEAGTPSLQQAVASCTWHIAFTGVDRADVAAAVEAVLAATELPVTRERKGRQTQEDVRPGIVLLRVLDAGHELPGEATLEAELATQPRSLRPAELVGALDLGREAERVVRLHQWTCVGGARRELMALPQAVPLIPPAATPIRTQQARAS